jgi:hypothetical protein
MRAERDLPPGAGGVDVSDGCGDEQQPEIERKTGDDRGGGARAGHELLGGDDLGAAGEDDGAHDAGLRGCEAGLGGEEAVGKAVDRDPKGERGDVAGSGPGLA